MDNRLNIRTPLFQGLALAALLLASSCAAPRADLTAPAEDGDVNHPISVEPSYESIKMVYFPGNAGISPADETRFSDFIANYEAHGNGSIAVSAPSGPASRAMIGFFAQRINDLGVPKDHILVASHDTPDGDQRVEINYVSYQARTEKCGDWSENLAYTADNETPKNFGCSVQQNMAAMIADPRDLLGPRQQDQVDATRRGVVVDHYEKGEVTQAAKHTTDTGSEQSAPGTSVGTN